MKKSWFVHSGLTEYQARELVERYSDLDPPSPNSFCILS